MLSVAFAGSRIHWRYRRLCKHPTRQPAKRTHSAAIGIDHCIICCSCWNLDSRVVWHEHSLYSLPKEWDIWVLCWRYNSRLYIAFPGCFRICQMEKADWFLNPPYDQLVLFIYLFFKRFTGFTDFRLCEPPHLWRPRSLLEFSASAINCLYILQQNENLILDMCCY